MKEMFTSSNLSPLLAKLTLQSKSEVHKAWSSKNNNRATLQRLIRKMGKDSTKKMVIRLHKKESVTILSTRAPKTVLWSRSSTNGCITQESDLKTGVKDFTIISLLPFLLVDNLFPVSFPHLSRRKQLLRIGTHNLVIIN